MNRDEAKAILESAIFGIGAVVNEVPVNEDGEALQNDGDSILCNLATVQDLLRDCLEFYLGAFPK